MKNKIIYFIITLVMFIPFTVLASEFGVTCTDEEMLKMQDEVKDVKIDVELVKEGTTIKSIYVDDIDISNTFKVSTKNLPSGYRIYIYPNINKTEAYLVTNDIYSTIESGGVYIVDFVNTKCGLGVIKSYEIMIPYFDKTNTNNIWFDGTYTNSGNNGAETLKDNISIKLFIILGALVLFILIIFIIKKAKKRSKINILLLMIGILLFGLFTNNVYATGYIVDSGGKTLNPSDSSGTSSIGLGIWLSTGVGFKVSLVNVNEMRTINDFVIIMKGSSDSESWSYWHYKASQIIQGRLAVGNNITGLSGKIANSYSTDRKTYVCSDPKEGNSEDSDCFFETYNNTENYSWFLIKPGHNTPNVSAENITNLLFRKNSNGTYEPTDTFYLYLARLLKNNTIAGVSNINDKESAKKLLKSNEFEKERNKLKNYRIIIEPIYIAGKISKVYNNNTEQYEKKITSYYLYTLKAAFVLSSLQNQAEEVNIAYQNDFIDNFKAIQESHGQINNPDNGDTINYDIKNSKSGYGYIIYGIVDENDDYKCNPNDETNFCCYNQAGIYNSKSSGAKTSDSYYCPTGYVNEDNTCREEVQVCISTPTLCQDTVNKAKCSGEEGTKAAFHESNDYKNCILDSEKPSGFTIVSTDDTTPVGKSTAYCEVACKDDFDFEFPTKKFALSGTFFTLDQYTPKVSIKRTCVTSKIDYSTFKSDFENARDAVESAYKTWQDYLEYYEHTTKIKYSDAITGMTSWINYGVCETWNECPTTTTTTTTSTKKPSTTTTTNTTTTTTTTKKCTRTCKDYKIDSCDYSYQTWSDGKYKAKNGTEFSFASGTKGTYNGTTSCPSFSKKHWLETHQDNAKTSAKEKEDLYNAAVAKYNDILKKYSNCTSWLDNKLEVNPKLTFETKEKDNLDSTIFKDNNLDNGSTKNFETYIKDNLTTDTKYWEQNEGSIRYDDKDNNTGKTNMPTTTLNGVICSNGKCDTTNVKVSTSSYIKKEESINYIYHLPTVYTTIPSGKVFTDKTYIGAYLELDEDSVPISINTKEGTYDYIIKISNLTDSIRQNARNKTADGKLVDNFEERFKNSMIISGKGNNGTEYVCEYDIKNDIYDPNTRKNLFFYRPVDITEINPLGQEFDRVLGYNWTDERAEEVISNMKETGSDYQKLTNGDYDKFEFTLTPSVMKAIRIYNNSNNYGTFDLTCSDTDSDNYHCTSAFLNCLSSLSGLESSSNLCNNILEGSNLTSVTNYGYDELQDNREILIKKLADLSK